MEKYLIPEKKEVCRRCPYYHHSYVAGYGNPHAKIVLVGDSPWKTEERTGLPFQGPAGEMLDLVLEDVDIDRKDIFITNAVHCVPDRLGEEYPAGVVELCTKHFLRKEIERINPEVIVPMGNNAVKGFGLVDRGNISKIRGVERTITWFNKKYKMIPTFHPSYLIHNPAHGEYVAKDLRLAKGEVIKEKAGHYLNVNSLPRLEVFWQKIQEEKIISLDVECTSLDYRKADLLSINISLEPYKCHVITFYNAYPVKNIETYNKNTFQKLYKLLHDPTKRIFLHNGKFDLNILHYHFLRTLGKGIQIDKIRWYDTQGMAALYNENMRKGLKDICSIRTDIRYSRKELDAVHGGKIAKLPIEDLVEYGGRDGDGTRRIGLQFATDLLQDGLWYGPFLGKDYSDMSVANALLKMEHFGSPISRKKVFEMQHIVEGKLTHFESSMQRIADTEFNVRSNHQLRDIIYKKLNFPSTGLKTKKGNKESTAKEAIAILNAKFPESEFLQSLGLYRKYETIYKTFIKGFLTRTWDDGRLRPDFDFTRIVSGRVASRNPNILNVPRDKEFEEGILLSMRETFTARPGHLICMADFSQAEFKCAALRSKDKKMIDDIFVHRKDFHDMIAKSAFPKYESYEREAKDIEATLSGRDEKYIHTTGKKIFQRLNSLKVMLKQWRTLAKNYNFGLIYGAEDDTLAAALGVTKEKVGIYNARIENTYSLFWKFIKEFPQEAIAAGFVRNSFNRMRHVPYSAAPWIMAEYGRKSINFIGQSDAAYICRGALVRIVRRCEEEGLEGFPFNIIYDAILLECPEEERDICVTIMAEEMLRPVEELDNRSFSVGIGWGKSWHDAEAKENKLHDLNDLEQLLAA